MVVTLAIANELAAGFVHEVPVPAARHAELVAVLAEIWQRARAAWPALEVAPDRFGAAVATGVRDGDAITAIGELAVEDLYLAQACATGARAALDAFGALYDAALLRTLRQMKLAADVVDDVAHEVRTRLFVGGGTPRIATYSGRATLASWLRTIATRAAVDRLRNSGETADEQVLEALPDGAVDPALAHLRATYHGELKAAFEEALATLEVRERNLLRQHFVDGLTLEDIGALYAVHKTTVYRWIETTRTALAKRTRAALQRRVRVLPDELDSILRLLRSHIDLSLSRVLR